MRRGGEVRRWLAAGLFMAASYLIGTAVAGSLCYWAGRWQGRGLPARALGPPADASAAWAASGAGLVWLGLWVLFVRTQRWKRFGRLFAAAPLALFCWALWRAATAACSLF